MVRGTYYDYAGVALSCERGGEFHEVHAGWATEYFGMNSRWFTVPMGANVFLSTRCGYEYCAGAGAGG